MQHVATLSELRGITAFCLVAAGLSVVGLPQPESTGSQGNWLTKTPLLTQRAEVGVASLDGKIYVVGGEALGEPA